MLWSRKISGSSFRDVGCAGTHRNSPPFFTAGSTYPDHQVLVKGREQYLHASQKPVALKNGFSKSFASVETAGNFGTVEGASVVFCCILIGFLNRLFILGEGGRKGLCKEEPYQ